MTTRSLAAAAVAGMLLVGAVAVTVKLRARPQAATSRPVVFVSTRGNKLRLQLHTMALDGKGARRVTTGDSMEVDPAWSPDGKHIAYAAVLDLAAAVNSNLFVIDADGSHRRQIGETDKKAMALAPSFSPDGARLVYSVAKMNEGKPPDVDLLVVPAAGGIAKKIADGTLPAWSPDGKRILFTAFDWSQSFAPRLVSVTPEGGEAHDLTTGEERAMMGAWSPDGKRIAYIAAQGSAGKPDLFVMNADGSDKRPLTHTDDSFEISPVWSDDGSEILFARVKENKEQLRAATLSIRPDGTGLRALTDYDVSSIPGSGVGFFLLLITGQPGSLFE